MEPHVLFVYDCAMQIQPHVVNRLIAARHLIDSSGQELTAYSDALVVAQKILLAHDAAELSFIALSSQLNLRVPELDGKPKAESSFMALAKAVSTATYPSESHHSAKSAALFEHLNQLRVAFKHRGLPPNVASSFHLFSEVVEELDSICRQLIGLPLTRIQHAAAIYDDTTRDLLDRANTAISSGLYKEALETISLALHVAFRTLNIPSNIKPGEISTEDALLLSGRGIDPASFITTQKFLPVTHNGEDVIWDLRKHGHEMNWTDTNATFCLQTAISSVIRLQPAQEIPTPSDFYTWFEDVVTVLVDKPKVYRQTGSFSSLIEPLTIFDKGSRIKGRVNGSWERKVDYGNSTTDFDLEHAPYICLLYPKHELLEPLKIGLFNTNVLWFENEEVAISYESNGMRESIRKQLEQGHPNRQLEIDSNAIEQSGHRR
jgi:hypothetical protein